MPERDGTLSGSLSLGGQDPGRFEALITWSLIALIIFHSPPPIHLSLSISFSICIHFHSIFFFFLRHLHSVSFFASPVTPFFLVVVCVLCPVFYPLVFFNLQPGIFQLGRQKSPVFHLCIFRFTSFPLLFRTERVFHFTLFCIS